MGNQESTWQFERMQSERAYIQSKEQNMLSWISNMSMRAKLLGGFCLVALIAAVVGFVGASSIQDIVRADQVMYEQQMTGAVRLGNAARYFHMIRTQMFALMVQQTEEKRNEVSAKIDNLIAKYEKSIDEWHALQTSDEQKVNYEELTAAYSAYAPYRAQVLALARQGKIKEALDVVKEAAPKTAALDIAFNKIDEQALKEGEALNKANSALGARSMTVMYVAIALAVIIAIGLGLFVSGNISKPVQRVIGAMNDLVSSLQELMGASKAIAEGQTAVQLNTNVRKLGLSRKDEVGSLSKSLDTMVDSQEALKGSFQVMTKTIESLVQEMGVLAASALDGKLDARGESAKFEGGYRDIVQGVNNTLDAVIGPLRLSSNLMERISKGDIPERITDQARGEFQILIKSVNRCIDAVNALVVDAVKLSEAAVAGKLSERADAAKHQGNFRKIVEGVNATLDSVVRPVEDSAQVLSKMAQGDMTVRVEGQYQGDHRKIVESINTVATSLERALREVSEAVSATASASSQISSSTEEMAAGAQEQTSQAGEVASAVEEMTKTILENSRNAGVAADTAKNAKQNAERGMEVVAETVEGMKRIAEVVQLSAGTVRELGKSSDQIGEIISVIDDIADQTNLLALNAAIEAARAGEQGRGFAVVADEVRKLAERTTKATKEIAGMIKKIQSDTAGAVSSMEEGTGEVEKGKQLADRAGASLREIVGVSQKVTDMVTQIAAASEEQSSASEQISKNVEAISKVTGETAQGTQQIARAAEDLNRLTERLQELVSRFTVSGGAEQRSRGGMRDSGKSGVAVKASGALTAHH
jgi:methyl-accepting chemotaxis protein